VRSRNDQTAPPANEFFLDDFRLRAVNEFAVQNFFEFRVAARNRIPDNRTVALKVGVFRLVTVDNFDARDFRAALTSADKRSGLSR
jgi:hypothetical protein